MNYIYHLLTNTIMPLFHTQGWFKFIHFLWCVDIAMLLFVCTCFFEFLLSRKINTWFNITALCDFTDGNEVLSSLKLSNLYQAGITRVICWLVACVLLIFIMAFLFAAISRIICVDIDVLFLISVGYLYIFFLIPIFYFGGIANAGKIFFYLAERASGLLIAFVGISSVILGGSFLDLCSLFTHKESLSSFLFSVPISVLMLFWLIIESSRIHYWINNLYSVTSVSGVNSQKIMAHRGMAFVVEQLGLVISCILFVEIFLKNGYISGQFVGSFNSLIILFSIAIKSVVVIFIVIAGRNIGSIYKYASVMQIYWKYLLPMALFFFICNALLARFFR